ncbi:MAG: 50S ribosomal protein L9, partial [Waddliaceae bacterium]
MVSVKPGYARNYLLPKRLAVIADKNTLKMQEKLQEERRKKAATDRKDAEELAKHLESVVLTAMVKVDEEGHMYGSVSALDIVHMLKEQQNMEIEKGSVQLKHP